MPLNNNTVEQLAEWCLKNDSLVDVRTTARRDFFGYDEPGEFHYMAGVGEVTSRERRFLGWFALTYKLPDGRSPAELAVASILSGSEIASTIDLIKRSRYVLATVAMVNPGRGLILSLEDEEFTVENRQVSRILSRDDALCAHIIPDGRRGWSGKSLLTILFSVIGGLVLEALYHTRSFCKPFSPKCQISFYIGS